MSRSSHPAAGKTVDRRREADGRGGRRDDSRGGRGRRRADQLRGVREDDDGEVSRSPHGARDIEARACCASLAEGVCAECNTARRSPGWVPPRACAFPSTVPSLLDRPRRPHRYAERTCSGAGVPWAKASWCREPQTHALRALGVFILFHSVIARFLPSGGNEVEQSRNMVAMLRRSKTLGTCWSGLRRTAFALARTFWFFLPFCDG